MKKSRSRTPRICERNILTLELKASAVDNTRTTPPLKRCRFWTTIPFISTQSDVHMRIPSKNTLGDKPLLQRAYRLSNL